MKKLNLGMVILLELLLLVFLLSPCLHAGSALDLLYVQSEKVGGSKPPSIESKGGVSWQSERGSYRAKGSETLSEIAARVYGDRSMWPLIYYANEDRFAKGSMSSPDEEVLLRIPPPPKERVFSHRGSYYVKVLPGDTFRTLSRALYGRDDLWRHIYEANRSVLSSPQVSSAMARHGTRLTLVFRIPAPSGDRSAEHGIPSFPDTVDQATLPDDYQQMQQRPSPGLLQGSGQEIARLELNGPQDIGRREAEIILRDTGFICSRNPTFDRAMNALRRAYYGRGSRSLDSQNKERLFQLYTWYREALSRYGEHSTVSAEAMPGQYDAWVSEAARELTAVPANQRERLMRSLMTTESSKTHWSDYRPVISNCGAVGFGQFLPATAQGIGINPFDPRENINGIAIYLNRLIRRHGLRKGLAAYNGGNTPPSSSYRYADRILSRAGMAA